MQSQLATLKPSDHSPNMPEYLNRDKALLDAKKWEDSQPILPHLIQWKINEDQQFAAIKQHRQPCPDCTTRQCQVRSTGGQRKFLNRAGRTQPDTLQISKQTGYDSGPGR